MSEARPTRPAAAAGAPRPRWRRLGAATAWDLTALLNAADPRAPRAERHRWMVRLIEWLRHGPAPTDEAATPRPVLRLKHLLNVLERHPDERGRIVHLLARLWHESDVATLFADFGFTPRRHLGGEMAERLSLRLLPANPDSDDLGMLFGLAFTDDGDAAWIRAIDTATLLRLGRLLGEAHHLPASALAPAAPRSSFTRPVPHWREPLLQAVTWLVSAVRAAAFAPPLRRRMAPERLADRPFEQLTRCTEAFADALRQGDARACGQQATMLRALLGQCRRAADSVHDHLEEHGVSVNIVFEVQQLKARIGRLEALVDVLLADEPGLVMQGMVADLVQLARERRSLRALLAEQYSLLARKVAERHAETGEHYITRDRAEYRAMLRAAAGGGVVIAGTTFLKFALVALALAPFWSGLAAGLNYALSFLLIHLLHWTVATKQPAMTAPAMADKLAALKPGERDSDAAVEGFVDEITHLVRSQIAGIAGNLALVAPVVVGVQALAWWSTGRPLVSEREAAYVLHSITLLGPTALYAAFTGVLLFASSLVAGWVENWFVYHQLPSALAHHPGIVGRLGALRAERWARWCHANVSGIAANVSLGLMLGLVPVLFAFVGLPVEVRHVTLSTGQLAAAVSTLGARTLAEPAFWWCVAGLAVTGALNLGVSFRLAMTVAMRSRGIGPIGRQRLRRALWRRWRTAPRSFLLPPEEAPATPEPR